jgi:hypothetical protein
VRDFGAFLGQKKEKNEKRAMKQAPINIFYV